MPILTKKVDRDIMEYVVRRSKTDLKELFDSFPLFLREDIIKTLSTQSQGMYVTLTGGDFLIIRLTSRRFLWAHLQLNEIRLRKTEADVRLALKVMPQGLNETYKRISDQINLLHLKLVKEPCSG